MNDEKIIDAILSKNSELNRKKICEELAIEKQKTSNLINDETLLRLIGARYGVESEFKTPFDGKLSISDLIPGLYNVSLIGRIVAIFPIKFFQGNHPGKLVSLIISDKNNLLRVVMWNEKTEFIESNNLKPGQILLFSQGYTREDPKGKVELHISQKSKITILQNNVNQDDYPSIRKFSTKIGEITPKLETVHLIGTVKKVFPASRFSRSDSSEGIVLRFIIFDKTGELPVIVWNEKAESLKPIIKKNVVLMLVNIKVKLTSNNSIELHANFNTYIDKFCGKKNDDILSG